MANEQDIEAPQQHVAGAMKMLPELRKQAATASGLTAVSLANEADLKGALGISADGKNPNLIINEPKNAKTGAEITSVTLMEDGKPRHFTRIHTHDAAKSPTGLEASAWMEVKDPNTKEPMVSRDGKKNIVIAGQGFLGSKTDLVTPAFFSPSIGQKQAKELYAVGDGKLTKQTLEVNAFLDATLKAASSDGTNVSLTIGSHSMNASAALAMQTFATVRGIDSQAMLFDPVSGTTGVNRIREALGSDEGKLSAEQKTLRQQLIKASGGEDPEKILLQFDQSLASDVTSFASRSWQEGWDTRASRPGSMKTNDRSFNFSVNAGTTPATAASQLSDEGNRPPGRVYYVDGTTSEVAGADPIHKIVNIFASLTEGHIVAPSELMIPLGQNAYKTIGDIGSKGIVPVMNELGEAAKNALSDFAGKLWNNVVVTSDHTTGKNPSNVEGRPSSSQNIR